jgi:hypothetical protein
MERKATIGSNDATIMEKLGAPGVAPTAVERKWAGGDADAEPTMLERQLAMAPAKKSSAMMFAAIAAVVVIIIGIGVFVMMRKPAPAVVATNTVSTAGTQVTTTAPVNQTPIAGGDGALLLSASPYAEIEKITDAKGSSVPMPDDTSTPTRVVLKPGTYKLTLKGPEEGTRDIDVTIEAGRRTPRHVNMTNVNVDDLAKEMNKP